jgi:protein AFG1
MSSQEEAHSSPVGPSPLQAPLVSGTYLYGPVGSGKTMIMDMFYSTLKLDDAKGAAARSSLFATVAAEGNLSTPGAAMTHPETAVPVKRRLHFHEFMLLVHARLHALQQARPRVLSKSRLGLPVYR